MGEKRQEVLDEKGEEPGVTLGREKTPGSAKRKERGNLGSRGTRKLGEKRQVVLDERARDLGSKGPRKKGTNRKSQEISRDERDTKIW